MTHRYFNVEKEEHADLKKSINSIMMTKNEINPEEDKNAINFSIDADVTEIENMPPKKDSNVGAL